MGRGRAKAKQTKVARDLKYRTHETDFGALANELHGGESEHSGPSDQAPTEDDSGEPDDAGDYDSWSDHARRD